MSTASKFYNIFWNSEQCQSIFLLHKEQLLEKDEIDLKTTKKSYYHQRFVISNSLTRKDSFQRIEQRIQNRNIDTGFNLTSITTKNINEEKIKKYFTDKFGKSIELISKKINGNNFAQIKFFSEIATALMSENRLLEFLKKYHVIDKNLNSFEELVKSFDKIFQNEISTVINSEHFTDLFKSFDELSNFYNNYTFDSLIASNKFYTDILYDKENYKSRLELFDSLYDSQALVGGHYKAHYECVHCPVNTFSGSVTLNVTPSKIKLKCPNCNKEVFYLAPYKINDEIFNDIRSKDGLLFHALRNILEYKGIQIHTNAIVGQDIELDFQILSKNRSGVRDIVEVKMFKTDRPADTTASNLRDGFKKLLNARQKLIALNPGYKDVVFHFLTNITDSSTLQELHNSFKNEITGNRIVIHNVKSFRAFIDRLVETYQ